MPADQRRLLQESLDDRLESANFHRNSLKTYAGLGGAGLFLTGISVMGVIAGAPEAVLGIAVGGGMAGYFGRDAMEALGDYTQMVAEAAQRKFQLAEFDAAANEVEAEALEAYPTLG